LDEIWQSLAQFGTPTAETVTPAETGTYLTTGTLLTAAANERQRTSGSE
jgi:hypothetical protein